MSAGRRLVGREAGYHFNFGTRAIIANAINDPKKFTKLVIKELQDRPSVQ